MLLIAGIALVTGGAGAYFMMAQEPAGESRVDASSPPVVATLSPPAVVIESPRAPAADGAMAPDAQVQAADVQTFDQSKALLRLSADRLERTLHRLEAVHKAEKPALAEKLRELKQAASSAQSQKQLDEVRERLEALTREVQ